MYSRSQDFVRRLPAEGVPRIAGSPADPLGVERPPSLARKLVEFLLYVSIANSAFAIVLGVAVVPYIGGALITASGMLTLIIMFFQREPIPATLWFALIVNFGASFSQGVRGEPPMVGEGLATMMHWMNYQLMICYLVRNDAARNRILVFFSVLLILTIMFGSTTERDVVAGRIDLSEGVASCFTNPNRLGHICAMLSVALLFWSLRCAKVLRPLLWVMVAILTFYMFGTVTRGAVLSFACGVAVLCAAIVLGRGMRVGGIVLIGAAILAMSQFAYMFADSLDFLEDRMQERSSRYGVYSMGTVRNLVDTTFVGWGTNKKVHMTRAAAGIEAHNSLLYMHMSFGGFTAWVYLAWIIMLLVRLARMVRAPDWPLAVRLEVVALFGMMLASHLLQNQGYVYITSMFAVGVAEKYCSPYSGRRIAERAVAALRNPHTEAVPQQFPV